MVAGQLRVYLGAGPGVGTTRAMLGEGRRLAAQGCDVVIGCLSTAERGEMPVVDEPLEGPEPQHVRGHGHDDAEMDVAALLARRPAVALVDDCAHTNAVDPDQLAARPHANAQRWQDIQQILAAGIDVITTVDVQHLESLADVVESITGARPTETVPDSVVRGAAAVELVELGAPARPRSAADGHAAALHELALLWLADRVDEGLPSRDPRAVDADWSARERVVVAVSAGAESPALLRRAARIASRASGGELMAVYVTRRDGLSAVSAVQLEQLRTQTEALGGTFHAVAAAGVAEGLLDFARGVNASQILLGASRRGRLAALLRPGVGDVVIADSGDIDVHVVTHPYARGGGPAIRRRPRVSRRRMLAGYAVAVVGTAALAALLYATPDAHDLPAESMLFMALVVATALVGGLWPAVTAALCGGLLLNYLFVVPTRTLIIADPEHAFAIAIFLLTGVAVASVVDRAARRTQQATRARAEANALAVLTHTLLRTGDDQQQLLARVCEVFGMSGAALLRTEGSGTAVEESFGDAPAGVGDSDAHITVTPGVIVAFRGHRLDAADQRLLSAYAAHFAIVRERREALAESRHAAELAEANRTRTALLAAVSHDLRTPLAGIKAASSSLRDTSIRWSAEDEAELLATIELSADRLETLVGNLLDLSRLQMGTINPLIGEVDLSSAVEWALNPIPGAEAITVALNAGAAVAKADPGLLDRVVANLAENALRHTGAGTAVEITSNDAAEGAWGRRVQLRVVDHGGGVAPASREQLFAPFQRLSDVPNGEGLGLGLAVARGLTEAMAGRLWAEDTPGGGLTMVVDLPVADWLRPGVGEPGVPDGARPVPA